MQSISFKIPKWKASLLLGLAVLLIMPGKLISAAPSLNSLQKQYRQAQARNDTMQLAKILRQMLDAGYKSEKRYKQLGDLYFFIKKDKEALDTFREQAKWANTPKSWENLSDLLIWKKHNEEGIVALQTALNLDKGNPKIISKLAGKYEYFKKISKAEFLLKSLYLSNNKSTKSGQELIEFYLRNSLVERAKYVMDELIQNDPDLSDSTKLKVLNVKINSWLSKPDEALEALQKLNVSSVPESDLEYAFDLALYGGNILLAEKVLNRLDSLGKEIWQKRLQLKKILGVPAETRKLIKTRIKKKEDSIELLSALYETYRAERDIENEIEILEKLLEKKPKNQTRHNLLLSHYIYSQKIERGIDFFEDLADDNQDFQLIRLNLSRLYLADQDFKNFNKTIQTINEPKFEHIVLDLQISAAYQQDDIPIIFQALKNLLEKTKNIAPEEFTEPSQENDLPEDKYLDILVELQYLAEDLGNLDEKAKYGKTAYSVLKSRYQQYPTENRLRDILKLGEFYASPDERLGDFKEAEKILKDITFFLKFYRYHMKLGHYEKAEELLIKMLSAARSIEDSVQIAEHTFGFVSYNFSRKLFSDILARDPNYTMGLKRLGQIGLYTDNYEEAVFYINKYLKVNSFDPEAIFNLGEALYFSHQPYDAEEQFELVISLLDYPKMNNYETLLAAISHLRLKNYNQALTLLQSAHNKDPADLSIKLNILETLVLQKKWRASLDLITKENLDDEQKKKRAREIVFKANLDPKKTKEDSDFKANLKFEELKAIVDLQLALRVNIIRHLCLEGLGREKEDRQLLVDLAEKHPGNQEVLITLGYFYLDRAEDKNAMIYLAKARNIPPYDPILNRSHRELIHAYSTSSGIQYIQLTKINNGQQEYSQQSFNIYGKIMFNEPDRISYEISTFSSNRFELENDATSTSDSVDTTSYKVGYKANIGNNFNLALTHGYEVYLWFQELTGYQIKYLAKSHSPSIAFQLDLFSDLPSREDFDSVKAKTYNSGFELESSFALKSLKQNYSFSYLTFGSHFENDNYEGEPNQSQLSVGFTQSMMTYPNNLDINLSYISNSAAGQVAEYDSDSATTTYKHIGLPYTQIQTTIVFLRNWSEFFSNSFTLGMQSGDYSEFTSDNKTTGSHSVVSNSIGIELNYLKDKWSFSGFFNYLQETNGEKSEITIIGNNKTEILVEESISTIPEVGIAASYLF